MKNNIPLMIAAIMIPKGDVQALLDEDLLAGMKEGILELAENINDCTPYSAEFIHPFNGEKLTRSIVGMVENNCIYTEEMPNGGKMECKYPKAELAAISLYYIKAANAESIHVNVKTSFSFSSFESKVTQTIDGNEVDSPILESFENGNCIISGY